jgi:site-specific recombinase XerD
MEQAEGFKRVAARVAGVAMGSAKEHSSGKGSKNTGEWPRLDSGDWPLPGEREEGAASGAQQTEQWRIKQPPRLLHQHSAASLCNNGAAGNSSESVCKAEQQLTAAMEERRANLRQWLDTNRNQNTRIAYGSGWAGFAKHLEQTGTAVSKVSHYDVTDYLRKRVEEDQVASSTVKADRAAIADGLRRLISPSKAENILSSKALGQVVGVLKKMAPAPKPKRHMSAELMAEIIRLHEAKPPLLVTWLEERNVCLMLLMMMAMLRESELVALTMDDVVIKEVAVGNKPVTVLEVLIAQSKTDQGRVGQLVLLAEDKLLQERCPVWRLRKYLVAREERVRKGELAGDGATALFPTRGGTTMNNTTPCGIVQRAVQLANEASEQNHHGAERWGKPAEYGSHSMRRGGVTAARANGVPMLDIQRHGRWKSLTVFSYVGATDQERVQVTSAFLRSYEEKIVQRQAQEINAASVTAAAAAAAAASSAQVEHALGLSGKQQLDMLLAAGVDVVMPAWVADSDAPRPAAHQIISHARALRELEWLRGAGGPGQQGTADTEKAAAPGPVTATQKPKRGRPRTLLSTLASVDATAAAASSSGGSAAAKVPGVKSRKGSTGRASKRRVLQWDAAQGQLTDDTATDEHSELVPHMDSGAAGAAAATKPAPAEGSAEAEPGAQARAQEGEGMCDDDE